MSVNMIVLSGHLGGTPEEKTSEAGKRYCRFRLANNRWDSRKKEEVADWYSVTAFGTEAERCLKYLTRGSSVVVEGRIAINEWEKEGRRERSPEITATRVSFFGPPRGTSEGAGPPAGEPSPPALASPKTSTGRKYDAVIDVDSIPF